MNNAKEVYNNLVQQIDSDCGNKSYAGSLNMCKAEGMKGEEKPHGAMGQIYVYVLDFDNGDRVEFEFKWYDKSKTFSIKPDIHKFSVVYKPREGKPLTHSNAYEK